MKIKPDDFRVREGAQVNLKRWKTQIKPFYGSKEDYQKILAEQIEELSHLQTLHYASSRNALLIVFQGMDAAGKDSTIRHVMSGVNPQGCDVHSFKSPTPVEKRHDFLWRTTLVLPEKGKIGIFNRSYYEDVLIARVHPRRFSLPDTNPFWKGRYRSITDYESHLIRNGTKIVKIFLHISKDEQKERFLARMDDPEKNWKISLDDIRERKFWSEYQAVYEKCIMETSTHEVPWYVIPADDKLNARLVVSRLVIETLKGLKLKPPRETSRKTKEWRAIREHLQAY